MGFAEGFSSSDARDARKPNSLSRYEATASAAAFSAT